MSLDGFGGERRRRSSDMWVVRALRGLSGVVAGGVVVLTLVVIGVAYLASNRDFPGPGRESVAAHVVSSVVVVVAQVLADRRRGAASVLASAAVLAVTGLLLWTQWWM
ncbi:hypothetical protein [Prescottella agglutinans]|uniref:Uncharacterized protein n=1 Tax=Prescottella agglutinans TaxID=1644129 RepID=A0ABT6MF86_9NOCA|nr:hypothetical protein [Prescottella agglutinans]MDH6282973.1 hypothetical protein [Prescottella agglutinans]